MGHFVSIFQRTQYTPSDPFVYSNTVRRRLEHLLRANHANLSIIHYSGAPNLFLQHLPALYLLGISAPQLLDLYDQNQPSDCVWQPSPCVIIKANWKFFLGKKEYAEGYKHYFDDELINMNFNQLQLMKIYTRHLLAMSLLSGGKTYIYLGLAFILKSQEMTSEALTSMCLHIHVNLLDQKIKLNEWSYGTYTLCELLSEMAEKKEKITNTIKDLQSLTEELMYISQYISKWNSKDYYKSLKEIEETTLLLAITASESIRLPFISLFNASQTVLILSKNMVLLDSHTRLYFQIILFHILLNYISLGMPCIQPNKLNQYPPIDMKAIKNDLKLVSFNTEKLIG
ncbi:uncharacterized protein T551_00230 [Pneumocystis jirovecii RU7]|uniref:Uncharacterized protein n=1 Tax=Pneumocystis jirovecii (strain RU7) TaxID=1408657 RepID=A0A0W4ZWI4_PNEJ7|nr:uncharacterized protein T551_00230 [Pneumocystis jirovecii RU7]KTW32745.1 hypothetical protein T551_00230 [Pneumocystis jirovecii RU7]